MGCLIISCTCKIIQFLIRIDMILIQNITENRLRGASSPVCYNHSVTCMVSQKPIFSANSPSKTAKKQKNSQ